MADFNVPMIGTEVKPVPQTSLGDMLNIARGAQQYQQAQQINPLELQTKQQATRTGEIQLGVVEQANKERLLQMKFLQDPKNWQDDNGNVSIPKLNEASYLFPQTFAEFSSKLTTLGTAQTEGAKAKQNLTQDKKALISSFLGSAGRFGVDDPAVVNRELQNFLATNPNDPEMKNLVEKAYVPIFSQMQKGPGVTDALIKASQAIMSPAQQQTTFAPTITTTAEGKTTTTTPGVGITPPTATIGMAGGLQANVPSTGGPNAVGAGAEIAPGMRVPYPVRKADQPYMPEPSEAKDQLSGQAYRDRLIAGQGELPQGKRNVEEVIKQANLLNEDLYSIEKGGGFPGLIGRKIRMAVNSAEYDMLAKDLARMALSNSTAMGGAGNTVSGLDMAQVANGTIKMPPEKLVGIARRVQADQTNLDLQAKGAQIFAQSHGDNNMKAYQQAWNANADTKIFEAMNIYKAISDPQKRKDQIDALLGNDPAKRKEFFDMYENILSLSNTGLTKVKKDK
jgi:hypothetical protein